MPLSTTSTAIDMPYTLAIRKVSPSVTMLYVSPRFSPFSQIFSKITKTALL